MQRTNAGQQAQLSQKAQRRALKARRVEMATAETHACIHFSPAPDDLGWPSRALSAAHRAELLQGGWGLVE